LISVKDQVLVRRLERKRFAQLLHDPQTGRVAGDVEVQDTPTVMSNDKEAVENTEGDGVNREEIHSGNDFAVVLEKRLPSISSVWISWSPLHPAGDGSFRDIEAKHLQFAVNAGSAPSRVFDHHLEDEFAQFLADPSSSDVNSVA
jgi:hypothetical protein